MPKNFSISDLSEDALLMIFDSFMKEHKDMDHTELAKMLGIPPQKMEHFREIIDDLQVHNANAPKVYFLPSSQKKKPTVNLNARFNKRPGSDGWTGKTAKQQKG